ncbi:MAG: GNAT family N-acetyltransferase [Candidatus Kariarchaeaceae archaeon]|jgi:ribosomal protein S18 acetylase RimI-like enzyme
MATDPFFVNVQDVISPSEIDEDIREAMLDFYIDLMADRGEYVEPHLPDQVTRSQTLSWLTDYRTELPYVDNQKYLIREEGIPHYIGWLDYLVMSHDLGDTSTKDPFIFKIFVNGRILRAHRRQGIGRKAWEFMIETIKRTYANFEIRVSSKREVTQKFYESIGFDFVQERVHQRLVFDHINWSQIQSWVDRYEASAQSQFYRLAMFQTCPEEIIDEFCDVYKKIKGFGGSSISGPYQLDPEIRRKRETEYGQAAGTDWTTIIVWDPKGKIVGLTETYVVNVGDEPWVAHQELTGILPEHRHKGLAQWLKGKMLLQLSDKYASLKEIVTSNYRGGEKSEDGLLTLNASIGYREYETSKYYSKRYQS